MWSFCTTIQRNREYPVVAASRTRACTGIRAEEQGYLLLAKDRGKADSPCGPTAESKTGDSETKGDESRRGSVQSFLQMCLSHRPVGAQTELHGGSPDFIFTLYYI